jgi:hypothetical protein
MQVSVPSPNAADIVRLRAEVMMDLMKSGWMISMSMIHLDREPGWRGKEKGGGRKEKIGKKGKKRKEKNKNPKNPPPSPFGVSSTISTTLQLRQPDQRVCL